MPNVEKPTILPKPGAKPAATAPDKPQSSPAPAPEDAEKETPKAPTPEELKASAEEFMEAAFGNPKPKAADKPKPEPEPEPEPEPKKEPEPEPEKPKPAAKPKAKRYGAEEVETITRRVIAEEREAAADDAPADPPAAPHAQDDLSTLSDEDQDRLQVLAELETINPAHKGIVAREKAFLKKASDYRAKYEATNGAGSFNPDDAEHAEFYRKNTPFIPPRELKNAERSMIARDAAAKAREEYQREIEPKFREIEAEKAKRAAEPVIAQAQADAVEEVFKSIPDFAPLVEAGALTREAVDKMAEVNPALHHYASEEAETMMGVIGELERLDHLQGHYAFNPATERQLSSGQVIYPHAVIQRSYNALEQVILSKPEEDRMDGGRQFITGAERARREQAIKQSNLSIEQKKRQWKTLDETTWSPALAHVKNFILKQSKDRLAGMSKKFGSLTRQPAANGVVKNGATPPAADSPRASAKAGLARNTSTASVSDTADNAPGGQDHAKKEEDEFVASAFGG